MHRVLCGRLDLTYHLRKVMSTRLTEDTGPTLSDCRSGPEYVNAAGGHRVSRVHVNATLYACQQPEPPLTRWLYLYRFSSRQTPRTGSLLPSS